MFPKFNFMTSDWLANTINRATKCGSRVQGAASHRQWCKQYLLELFNRWPCLMNSSMNIALEFTRKMLWTCYLLLRSVPMLKEFKKENSQTSMPGALCFFLIFLIHNETFFQYLYIVYHNFKGRSIDLPLIISRLHGTLFLQYYSFILITSFSSFKKVPELHTFLVCSNPLWIRQKYFINIYMRYSIIF